MAPSLFLPQGQPGMPGGVGQPGSVGEKVNISHQQLPSVCVCVCLVCFLVTEYASLLSG